MGSKSSKEKDFSLNVVLKKKIYQSGFKNLKKLMVQWEWESDVDEDGNIVWELYNTIVSFIIECQYILYNKLK